MFAHRQWPARIVEDTGLRFEGDVGVDQRRTAQAATDHHVLLGVDVQIEQPGARTDVAVRVVHLQFLGGCQHRVRVFAGLYLPAPFQQADPLAGAGQARRRDPAAVTRADDDHVVMFLDVADGRCDPCHGTFLYQADRATLRLPAIDGRTSTWPLSELNGSTRVSLRKVGRYRRAR